jgi:hypothetical protein
MVDSCALPCALCGRALSESRSRECGPPKSSGGRVKRKRGASIDDKDDEDDAPVVEKLPAEGDAEAVPKKKKRVKPPTEDDPDHALAQDLSDRKLLNLSVKVLSLAIGDRKVADKWAKTILTQLGGGLHALCTAKRVDLLKLRCQGNKKIPKMLVDRLMHVFGPPQAAGRAAKSKSTTPTKPTAAAATKPKPTAAKPVMTSRKIPRLPK